MIKSLFYMKIAWDHLRKNARTSIPFLLSAMLCVLMLYMVGSLADNPELAGNLMGGPFMVTILQFGSVVILLFSFIFLFYTNSFLMKQRKKEFGLYNVLGMGKRQIALVVFYELFFSFLISLAAGLVLGILLSKLAFLILARILGGTIPYGFYFSWKACRDAAAGVGLIFLLMFLYSMASISQSSPVELLHSENVGEKEPKTRWLIALAGVVFLALGYTIACTIQDPVDALLFYLFAVLLVIAGTYCLFTAGSIAFLKLLQKNRKFYYQTRHFINVSNMKYRMKQNGISLANICVLSTMVLVTVSSTATLYADASSMAQTLYDRDVMVSYQNEETVSMQEELKRALLEGNFELEDLQIYETLMFPGMLHGSSFGYDADSDSGNWTYLSIIPLNDFNALNGTEYSLEDSQVLLQFSRERTELQTIQLYGLPYDVKEVLPSLSKDADSQLSLYETITVVVADASMLPAMAEHFHEMNPDFDSQPVFYFSFNLPENQSPEQACTLVRTFFSRQPGMQSYSARNGLQEREILIGELGGFFFIGILLSVLFMAACILIMYYKQISEGYQDQKRFDILSRVGLDADEMKRTIRSQVLTVFFLPLLVSLVHILFNYPIVSRLLLLFGFTDSRIFILVTLACAGVFALLYALIYALTSRAYYRIVSEDFTDA